MITPATKVPPEKRPTTASPEAADCWARGSEIAGFHVLRPVWLGGRSVAYSVRDATGRLAMLQKAGATDRDPSLLARLDAEVKRYRSVAHANLCEIYDVVEDDYAVLVATEFVDGASLQWHLSERERFDVASSLRIILSVAKAVDALHEVGIVHGAIRPSTIRLTPHGRAKLEIPRFAALAADDAPWIAMPAGLRAAEYLAPEQIRRPSDAGEPADVYSLGATLYHLITGVAPFTASDVNDLLDKKTHLRITDAAAIVPDLDRDVAEVIRGSLDPDPQRRPASVAALVERLRGKLEQVGKYTLLEQIGRSQSATLYLARDPQGRDVALKVFDAEAASDVRRLMRFYQEAKLAMQVDHPRVVRVLEVGVDGGRHFIAMDHVEGENLARWTMRHKQLDEPTSLRIIGQVADAVGHLHARGIVHRDVNPANILVDRAGNAYLSDLGLSKQSGFDLKLTVAGTGLGTYVFAAPEQLLDAKTVDASCDVYGLGATLYSMVTGRRPFATNGVGLLLLAKRRGDCIDPRQVTPSLTKQTAWLIRQAMRPIPVKRPTIGEFVKYVRACQRARGTASPSLASPPAGNPTSPSVWHILYATEDGPNCRVAATAEQIGRLIQAGQLDSATPTAARPDGPYLPLHRHPEFRHVLVQPCNAPRPRLLVKPASLPARVLARMKMPWLQIRHRPARGTEGPRRSWKPASSDRRSDYAKGAIAAAACIAALFLLIT